MQRTGWKKTVLVTALTIVASFAVGTTFAAYLGTGKWPSSSLRRCHIGSYATNCSNAANVWSNGTDLTLSYSCTSLNFQTLGGNYGATGYAGLAYICAGPSESDCDTQTAWNGSYTYAEARNNVYYLSTWTEAQRQFNCTHELGHCWSLGHDSRTTSVMQSGQLSVTALDSGNIADVNAKY
jgi:hypothetical protein